MPRFWLICLVFLIAVAGWGASQYFSEVTELVEPVHHGEVVVASPNQPLLTETERLRNDPKRFCVLEMTMKALCSGSHGRQNAVIAGMNT